MNELIKTTETSSGDIVVSGRELHEYLEVPTPYSIWIERMIDYGFEEESDFITFLLESTGGRRKQDHHLKLDMAKELAMLQRTERGKEARQYFIKVEKMWNDPEMVIKRAMDYQQKKISTLEEKIALDSPYTNYGKQVSASDGSINVGAFCKLIYDKHGINIGRNKMFQWLRDRGYLIKTGKERNDPKQRYLEQGLFESVPRVISANDHKDKHRNTTYITGKGQIRLVEALKNELQPQ